MDGPEGASARVKEWLTATVPTRLRAIEARLELPANSLANPSRIIDHEVGPIGLEDWPSIYVLPQRTERTELVDVLPDSSELYRVTYSIRVLAWVRADGYAATGRLRMRYALAIREALLERKSLVSAASYPASDQAAAVDPASIREDYSDVFTDDAKRTIAGVAVDVNVIVAEVLAGPPVLGEVDTIDVEETGDTAAIPPHPAL